jgi:hypothetical protein
MKAFKELKNRIKEEQKARATSIRELKKARKPDIFRSDPEYYRSLGYLERHQFDARHIHIAYSMFFCGRSYDQIERTCHTKPNMSLVRRYKEGWITELSATIIEEEEVPQQCACMSS